MKSSAVVAVLLAVPACSETALWVESSGALILSDRLPGSAKRIEQSGVRNQFVAVQLGLRSGQPLRFDWTALKGANGEIARERKAREANN